MNHEPRTNPPPESEGIAEERFCAHRKALADTIQLKCTDLAQHVYLIASDDQAPDDSMTASYARGQIRCIREATTALEILLLNFTSEERDFWQSKRKEICDE